MKQHHLLLNIRYWIGLTLFLLITPTLYAQIYVDADATGTPDGTSWDNAYTSLQDALSAAVSGNEIWVADGTYYPDEGTGQTDNARTATFQLKNGVAIYGGFASGETNVAERNWTTNPTILSGDIEGDDAAFAPDVDSDSDPYTASQIDHFNGGNSYHVVTGSGTNNTSVIDGFTITAGYANGGINSEGEGGGMYNYYGSPVLTNVAFTGNYAEYGGGGLGNDSSAPTLTNVTFFGNSATNRGGGMYNFQYSSPVLTNITFIDNYSGYIGGGMMNAYNSSPKLTNVTFSGNIASSGGGGMYNLTSSTVTMVNSIIWNNYHGSSNTSTSASISNNGSTITISYSLVQGQNPAGDGNLDGTDPNNAPQFTGAGDPDGADNIFGTPDDGLALTNISPAINMGSNTPFGSGGDAEGITTDLAGNVRIYNGAPNPDVVDMGAYELQEEPVLTISPNGNNVLFVDQSVAGGNGSGSSWTNAIPEFRDALGWSANEWDGSNPPLKIWVANGLYLPTGDGSTRTATFQLINNVEIYGGFAGGGTEVLSDRNWTTNLAILSGDIDGDDDPFAPETDSDSDSNTPSQTDHINGNNSMHVVTGSGTDATAIFDGFTITAGNADGSAPNNMGGGIYNIGGSPTVTNSTFSGNTADEGGGMYNYDSSPVVTNSTFSGNTSSNGGGMYNAAISSPTVTNSTFLGNTATVGGGMFNASSSLTVTNSTFSENTSFNGGGGMFIYNSSPVVTNSTFSGNTAGSSGGGMSNFDNSSPVVTNSTFLGNTASTEGGGMYNYNNSSPVITNSTFSGNTAGSAGGGMFIFSSSNPTVTNSIIWNNSVGGNTDTVSASVFKHESAPVFSYSLIANSGGSGSWSTSIGTDGGNNIDAAPLFFNASDPDGADNLFGTPDDGLALTNTSPAINAGNNAANSTITDLAGNARIYDGSADPDVIDMGAYEFQGEPTTETPSVVISGNAGWRMMGVPVAGVTVEDLAGINLVQGISGLPQAVGEPNLYFWESVAGTPDFVTHNGAYYIPADKTTTLPPGTGFFWYMYGPEANPELSESKTFPLTVKLTGDEITSDVSLGTLAADWHLIANPFISDIDFNAITDGTNPLGVSGSVWDTNTGAEGSYILTTSVASNNQLSVWQGAFIELGSSTDVVIPQSAKATGASFMKERPLAGQVEFVLEGSANGEAILDKAAILYFSEQATPGWDGYDVTKLTPFSQSWATVNLVGSREGTPILKSQHSLPYDFTGSENIPVDIELHNASGEFTLSWPVVSNLPSVELWLLDHQTGKRHDLSQPGQIDFSMQASNKEQTASEVDNVLRLPQIEPMRFKQNTQARFVILINPEELPEELPSQITLNQNYPNPFNPTTVISYQLPVNSDVHLEVFDMTGRHVATLVSGQVTAGQHTVNFDGSALSSGVYMYRLQTQGSVFTKKLTLIK